MTNSQKNRHQRFQFSGAIKDLVLLSAITVFILTLSYFFNFFALIVEFLQKNPDKIIFVDEIITGLLTLSIGLAVFAWRRWLELKKETAKRLELQEELIKNANTKAETERIISRQLHIEIEERKHLDLFKNPKFKK